MLPEQSTHPLFWSDADAAAWLTGSPLLARLRQRRQQLADDLEVLLIAGANDLPLAAQYKAATGSELVSSASVTWAAATLLSRAFSLDLNEEEPIEGACRPCCTVPVTQVMCLCGHRAVVRHCPGVADG